VLVREKRSGRGEREERFFSSILSESRIRLGEERRKKKGGHRFSLAERKSRSLLRACLRGNRFQKETKERRRAAEGKEALVASSKNVKRA